ncbi:MAG: hypothetical protein KDB68_11140 [Planctomycetes bacterium]|nr:hypothetical protein [Planctomycetota bacterium]MCA8936743.1 hypothetical protein [Planctomycetota bacterium]
MVWPMYGYAFAKLAKARGETKLPWLSHMREDVKVFTKQAMKWLKK